MVLHPFLFAVAPILFLYAINIYEASIGDAWPPLVISLVLTALVFLVLRAILKNKREAGLLVSLTLILFFSFGRFVVVAAKIPFLKGAPIAWLIYAAVFVAGIYLIVRNREHLKNATVILNIIAIALVLMSIVTIVTSSVKSQPVLTRPKTQRPDPTIVGDKSKLPDIYYIVFDSFAGERSMKEYYDYDNSGLTGFLRSKGFYVPGDSRSNYAMTEMCLCSALNMTYIEPSSRDDGANSNDKRQVHKLMRENLVAKFLKEQGYRYSLVKNDWFAWQGKTLADVTPVNSGIRSTDFLTELIDTTMLRGHSKPVGPREMALSELSVIPTVASREKGPVFVLAYILPPHPPFVFDENGNMPAKLVDMTNEDMMKKAYLEQYKYITKRIKKLVKSLLSKPGKKPVIIIQSDHGARDFIEGTNDMDKSSTAKIDMSFSALNSYYFPLPEGGTAKLYETITPVNSFRELFNLYFKTAYKRLPDDSFANTADNPFRFVKMPMNNESTPGT